MNLQTRKILVYAVILIAVFALQLMPPPAGAQYTRARSRSGATSAADQPFTSGPYTFKPVPYSNGAMVQIFDTKTGKGVGTVINGNVVAAQDQAAIQAAYDAHLSSTSKPAAAPTPAASSDGAAVPSSAGGARTAISQPAAASMPASTAAPSGSVSSSGSGSAFKYGVLDRSMIDRFPTAILMDLNLLRLRPELLDDKLFMRYFIALNNCDDQNVARMLDNELDYPDLAAQYKARAPEILKALPASIRMTLYRPAANAGKWTLWGKSLTLGDYNKGDGAFPFNYPGAKNGVEITGDMTLSQATEDRQSFLNKFCHVAAQKTGIAGYGSLPADYTVSSRSMNFKEFTLDETSARRYIERMTGKSRAVVLDVNLRVLDSSPEIEHAPNNPFKGAGFKGQIGRVTVVDSQSGEEIGLLYDDHSLPPPQPSQNEVQAPAPAGKAPAVNWNASDHLYDIRMSVYVFLAHSACPDWPLTDAQNTNLNQFLNRVQNGKFQETARGSQRLG